VSVKSVPFNTAFFSDVLVIMAPENFAPVKLQFSNVASFNSAPVKSALVKLHPEKSAFLACRSFRHAPEKSAFWTFALSNQAPVRFDFVNVESEQSESEK
jgi:hypothetical protein